jgi:hypothetical protein
VTVAIRSGPVLGATVTRTEPSPRPEPGDTDNHGASLAAVHAQSVCVRTSTLVSPPLGVSGDPAAVTWKRHGAASCDTSSRRSATAIDPRRVAGSAFSAMRYVTVPSPCPSADEVSAIQPDEVEAFQEHSRAMAIVTVPVPPEAANELDELATVPWQRVSVGLVRLVCVELPQAPATAPLTSSTETEARRFTVERNAQRPPDWYNSEFPSDARPLT